jgi:hypothetical protein
MKEVIYVVATPREDGENPSLVKAWNGQMYFSLDDAKKFWDQLTKDQDAEIYKVEAEVIERVK